LDLYGTVRIKITPKCHGSPTLESIQNSSEDNNTFFEKSLGVP